MNKKILLVEDEQKIALAYQDYLRGKGYEVQVAADGEEGLEQMKSFRPDLLLLDLVMPRLDGMAVLRELKKNASERKTPVIVLTNLDQQEHMAQAAKLGSTLYFVKANTSLKTLARWIEDLLE